MNLNSADGESRVHIIVVPTEDGYRLFRLRRPDQSTERPRLTADYPGNNAMESYKPPSRLVEFRRYGGKTCLPYIKSKGGVKPYIGLDESVRHPIVVRLLGPVGQGKAVSVFIGTRSQTRYIEMVILRGRSVR